MARFNKTKVISTMSMTKVIPIYYHKDIDVVKKIVSACYDGGIRVFEFTNRGEFAYEIFGELNKFVTEKYPDLILGVGSVIDAQTASLYIQQGTNFIIGPLFNADISKISNRHLISYIPGCGSVSEIGRAQESGCDLCKIFPGDVLGPEFVKGLKAPMPWTQVMVTGGVKIEKNNLKSWFDAGVTCVGVGSSLFLKEIIDKKEWKTISKLCNQVLTLAKSS